MGAFSESESLAIKNQLLQSGVLNCEHPIREGGAREPKHSGAEYNEFADPAREKPENGSLRDYRYFGSDYQ